MSSNNEANEIRYANQRIFELVQEIQWSMKKKDRTSKKELWPLTHKIMYQSENADRALVKLESYIKKLNALIEAHSEGKLDTKTLIDTLRTVKTNTPA
jgi:LPS O-antigen subunit length determinant protein (WzzB/FepE family)